MAKKQQIWSWKTRARVLLLASTPRAALRTSDFSFPTKNTSRTLATSVTVLLGGFHETT